MKMSEVTKLVNIALTEMGLTNAIFGIQKGSGIKGYPYVWGVQCEGEILHSGCMDTISKAYERAIGCIRKRLSYGVIAPQRLRGL